MLSLISIQYGDHRGMQGFLGKYHAMVAMDGLHDEKNWPQGLGIIELEERRRLVRAHFQNDRRTLADEFSSGRSIR